MNKMRKDICRRLKRTNFVMEKFFRKWEIYNRNTADRRVALWSVLRDRNINM